MQIKTIWRVCLCIITAKPPLHNQHVDFTLWTPDGPSGTNISSVSKRTLCSQTKAPQVREKTDCSLHQSCVQSCPETTQTSNSEVLLTSSRLSLPLALELQETSLTSSEKRSCLLHSAPVNVAKENSSWFFASPHVTEMVLLSAGGKLQVSHCVKGNESQDGGFPCVTGACSVCSVFSIQLQSGHVYLNLVLRLKAQWTSWSDSDLSSNIPLPTPSIRGYIGCYRWK